jgi:hypothetical protein
MSLVLRVLGSATPSPTPVEVPLAEQASPGVVGFLVTFAVAVAAIGLFLSLTKHLRIVDRRAAQVAREDEAAERPAVVEAGDDAVVGEDGDDGRPAAGPVSSTPSVPPAPPNP